MPNSISEIATCPATFGREVPGHNWISVTQSSDGTAPYRMCAKCGIRQHLMEQEGKVAPGLRSLRAGGAEISINAPPASGKTEGKRDGD